MATDAIIILERLRCIRESDAGAAGHSEPYIWPVLLWIDDITLRRESLVGVTAPALGNARVVIKNDMRAGQIADIPTSVGVLRVRFEAGLTVRRLILIVALWEEDETPEAALRAGFEAFSSELGAAIGNAATLFALSQASEEERNTIIETIKTRVSNRVESAIQDGLTGWQKARVFLGTLNLDDIIESAFTSFDLGGRPIHGELQPPEVVTTPITLTFRVGSSNDYEIQGKLEARLVRVDPCQAQVDAVRAAQSVVDSIDGEIEALQDELEHAGPEDKPFINSEIKRLREEDLAIAQVALDEALAALSICRSQVLPGFPIHPKRGTGSRAGNAVGVDEREIQGFRTKTFFDRSEHIAVTIASDGKSTIVAVPRTAISRRNQMGDDEYRCLKACKDIADLEERLNCILRCPVTRDYQVFIL